MLVPMLCLGLPFTFFAWNLARVIWCELIPDSFTSVMSSNHAAGLMTVCPYKVAHDSIQNIEILYQSTTLKYWWIHFF